MRAASTCRERDTGTRRRTGFVLAARIITCGLPEPVRQPPAAHPGRVFSPLGTSSLATVGQPQHEGCRWRLQTGGSAACSDRTVAKARFAYFINSVASTTIIRSELATGHVYKNQYRSYGTASQLLRHISTQPKTAHSFSGFDAVDQTLRHPIASLYLHLIRLHIQLSKIIHQKILCNKTPN